MQRETAGSPVCFSCVGFGKRERKAPKLQPHPFELHLLDAGWEDAEAQGRGVGISEHSSASWGFFAAFPINDCGRDGEDSPAAIPAPIMAPIRRAMGQHAAARANPLIKQQEQIQ